MYFFHTNCCFFSNHIKNNSFFVLSNSEGSIKTPIEVRCARILHKKPLYKAGGALSALIHLGYLGMFLSAFLAATILPFSSEIVLSALYSSGLNGLSLLIVASLGNVLGSAVNYALGFKFGKEIATQRLKVSKATFDRASHTFTKWGKWSLFLCWVPIIGDPITLVAGVLRSPLWFFILAVTLSKTARYAALLYVLG